MYYSMPLSNAGSINSEPIDPFHRRQPYYKSSAAIMSVENSLGESRKKDFS